MKTFLTAVEGQQLREKLRDAYDRLNTINGLVCMDSAYYSNTDAETVLNAVRIISTNEVKL